MNEFLKELKQLCDKYNLYPIGCGNEDSNNLVVLDGNDLNDWSKRIALDMNKKKYVID